jgi:hypothetical protein
LKTDHKTWAEWITIRERNQLDVARIIDWQVRPGEARCRADLTKANREGKCRQWIREFVWLANKHLVVVDIVETPKPEIRRQWQLHALSRPEIGDHMFTLTSRAPERGWAEPALKPRSQEGRLVCQTLIPLDYRLIFHGDGKAEAFDSAGKSLGPVEGNPYHREYGQKVVQIDPGNDGTQTVFLHVLTATEVGEMTPPRATYRVSKPGQIELTVDGVTTSLAVPEWFPQSH